MKKKIIKIIGHIMLIFSIIFLFLKIKNQNVDFQSYITNEKFKWIFLFIILIYIVVMYINAEIYKLILQAFSNKKINRRQLYNIYLTANLGKYLPGNIMQFVGRNVLATQYDLKQKDMMLSTLQEICTTIFAGMIVVIIFGHSDIIIAINYIYNQYSAILKIGAIVFVFIIVVCISLIIKFKAKISSYIDEINIKRVTKSIIICLVINIVTHLVSCSTYIILVKGSFNLPLTSACRIIGIYIIAWLVGFIIPGAPGGIGIKEAVLILLLNNIVPENIILVSVVLHRILNIIAEFLAFVLMRLNFIINKLKTLKN